MTPIDSVPGFHPGEPHEGPVPMRGVSSQAGLAAVRHGVVAPVTFEAGDRVEYVDGPQKYLRGVRGTVEEAGSVVVSVRWDGHSAHWAVGVRHLAHVEEATR